MNDILFELMIMSDDVSQRKDNWIRVESKSWLFGEGVIFISEYVKNSTEQFRIFHRLIISTTSYDVRY